MQPPLYWVLPPGTPARWAGEVPRQRNREHSSCRYGWAPGGSWVLVPACCVCDDASGARDRRRSRRTRGALVGCLPRAVRPTRATPRATQRSAPPAMRARATLSSSCSARRARRTSSIRMPSAPRLSGAPPRRAQFHVACAGVAASACTRARLRTRAGWRAAMATRTSCRSSSSARQTATRPTTMEIGERTKPLTLNPKS